MRSRQPRESVYRGRDGFSLLELLTVLMLLGILTAVAAPSGSRLLDNLAFHKQTRKIMAGLRYARLMAVTTGRVIYVRVDAITEQGFTLSGGVEHTSLFDLDHEDAIRLEPEVVAFYPEGRATPATVYFSARGRQKTLSIDALTGIIVEN